jgi:hypothetical protein
MTTLHRRAISSKSEFDPFQILKIPRNASSKEIKAAYFKLAKLVHPDVHSQKSSESFIQITKAYETLIKKRVSTASIEPGPAYPKSGWQRNQYADPSFYKGTFSTGPIYMSNGKMAGCILLISAMGGLLLSAMYYRQREALRIQILQSNLSSRQEYESVIQKSKKSSLEAEIEKLKRRL